MNSKWHLFISLNKSAIRLVSAGIAIITDNWWFLAYGIGVAEILGILEEIGDRR